MKSRVYCYPKIGVSGLGNCMLVWARAFICAQQNGFQMLAPQWVQPRIGAVRRGDPVKRFYIGEFTNDGYISGVRRLLLLLKAKRMTEEEWELAKPAEIEQSVRIIEFSGLRNYFRPLIPFRDTILAELKRIANPRAVRRADESPQPFVAVHVRRGDTTRQKISPTEILQVTPTKWFVEGIREIRKHSEWSKVPIKILSDGSRDELKEILDLPGCELATTSSAVGDILLLARSALLVASGYSTFSMWGSFLGRMPTLYHPGRFQETLFPPDSNTFEGEWEAGRPLPQFDRTGRQQSIEVV